MIAQFFGAIILCFYAFHNKFPLLTIHSGTYINAGFDHALLKNSTSLYGLFIAYSSWGKSIWIVVFCQALLLSINLFFCFRYFLNSPRNVVMYMAYIFFISFFLSASIITSTISPGIFTCLTMIGVALILFADELKGRDLYIVLFSLFISIGADLSNLLYVLLTLSVYIIWRRLKKLKQPKRVTILLILTSLILLAQAICHTPALNNPGSNFIHQLFNVRINNYSIPDEQSETFKAIYQWYNWETREYLLSRQFQNWLWLDYLTYTQLLLIPLLLAANILLMITLKSRLSIYFVLAIIIQAMISTNNNSIDTQTIWLLSLPVFIHMEALINHYKHKNAPKSS